MALKQNKQEERKMTTWGPEIDSADPIAYNEEKFKDNGGAAAL